MGSAAVRWARAPRPRLLLPRRSGEVLYPAPPDRPVAGDGPGVPSGPPPAAADRLLPEPRGTADRPWAVAGPDARQPRHAFRAPLAAVRPVPPDLHDEAPPAG